MMGRRAALASVAAGFVAAAAACAEVSPLGEPIAAQHQVLASAHIVLTNVDVVNLAEGVQLAVGKQLEVPLPPTSIVGGGTRKLAAATMAVDVLQSNAQLGAQGKVVFQHTLQVAQLPLSVLGPGSKVCAMSAGARSGAIAVTLQFLRDAQGVDVVLAAEPSVQLSGGAIEDTGGCLQGAAPGAVDAVAAQVLTALRSVLTARFSAAGRDVLQAVLPPGAEVAGQVSVPIAGAAKGKLAAQLRYAGPDGSSEGQGTLLSHNGQHASAALHVGIAAERAACAIDTPPPGIVPTPIGLATPAAPAGTFVLRRAVAVDESLLAHAAWAVQRSGALCQARSLQQVDSLQAQSVAAVAPKLAAWVKEPPSRVRFWPGKPAQARWIDMPDSAGAALVLPESTLEIVAPVAGVEVVILRVQGNFRIDVSLRGGAPGLRAQVERATADSVSVTSPLVGDVHVAEQQALAALIDAAIVHALAPVMHAWRAPGMTGAAVVGTARVGKRLWAWLEEAPPVDG